MLLLKKTPKPHNNNNNQTKPKTKQKNPHTTKTRTKKTTKPKRKKRKNHKTVPPTLSWNTLQSSKAFSRHFFNLCILANLTCTSSAPLKSCACRAKIITLPQSICKVEPFHCYPRLADVSWTAPGRVTPTPLWAVIPMPDHPFSEEVLPGVQPVSYKNAWESLYHWLMKEVQRVIGKIRTNC